MRYTLGKVGLFLNGAIPSAEYEFIPINVPVNGAKFWSVQIALKR